MALQPLRIESPTTACVVEVSNPRFADAAGVENADTITMDMFVLFNGIADNSFDTVTFARNATTATKNAAIRAKVNQVLRDIEGSAPLNNANIQIVGLPV